MFYLNSLIIYLLILLPSINTPFQSDDYTYFLKGISYENTIANYLGWSGRLVVDFISSFLLNYLPYTVYEMLNAFVFLVMCILVSFIPTLILNNSRVVRYDLSSIVLWVVFMAYWISNTSLGQTSFWIVGSVNYLWTIMWASAYICFLLYFTNINKSNGIFKYAGIFVLGFLAGCSNENTSISVVVFTVFIFFVEKNQRKLVLTGLASSLIGAVVLIASPGNIVRKKYFPDWYSKSTIEQFLLHVYERMPNAIAEYLHIYMLLIFLTIALLWLSADVNRKALGYGLFFVVLSVFSNFILAKAPYIGGRNLNTGLFLLLPPLSIIVYEVCKLKDGVRFYFSLATLLYCLIFFIPSYFLFSKMMIHAKIQHEIRNEIILKEKNKGFDIINIPNWYVPKLIKDTDFFDTYKSERMHLYYDVKDLVWDPVYFDYSILKTVEPRLFNMILKEDLELVSLYFNTGFFDGHSSIVFKFNNSLERYIEKDDNILFVHVYDINKPKEFINADILMSKVSRIGGSYYFAAKIKKLEFENISSINFGFYSSSKEVNSRSFKLDL